MQESVLILCGSGAGFGPRNSTLIIIKAATLLRINGITGRSCVRRAVLFFQLRTAPLMKRQFRFRERGSVTKPCVPYFFGKWNPSHLMDGRNASLMSLSGTLRARLRC